jgi:hypothetical protein
MKQCSACGNESPGAVVICRFCERGTEAEPLPYFNSEEPPFKSEESFGPIPFSKPSIRQAPVLSRPAPGVSEPTPIVYERAPADAAYVRAFALVMMVILVPAALGSAALGAVMLTQATMGVGLLCGACFLGILTRVIQAGLHHRAFSNRA